MSKAITGAAMLLGAVAMGVAAFEDPALVASPIFEKVMLGLVMGGISMEAGAIASALTSNRGMSITTRQPAAYRQIIYGMQRVGGVLVYESTTGSKKNQFNKVVVLSGQKVWGAYAIYLDGRQVIFSSPPTNENGVVFGGNADSNTHYGPNGVAYYFGAADGDAALVYVEARDGTQAAGDVMVSLTNNDNNWSAGYSGSPYLGGCAYLYVKVEYDPTQFPAEPEIRVDVLGKPVYDPRTGETTFSSNAALIAADIASDPIDGLGMPVNQAQLIAAANICDEQVALASGGTDGYEARYACHMHYDTGTAPSDAFSNALKAMGGRHAVIGGEVFIFPAAWYGPSFSFDQSALTAPLTWDATKKFKDNCNRITGTYTAPNFPYNIAGNLYDANGYYNGETQNNFQFAFQRTSFPQYAADPLHGFASDEYLNYDSGVTASWNVSATYAAGTVVSYTQTIDGNTYASVWRSLAGSNVGNEPGPTSAFWVNAAVALPMEADFSMVLSIAQAQRLAKIMMLRNRQWGAGTLEMGLAALAMQEIDVMQFTFPLHGWVDKVLEVQGMTLRTITKDASEDGEPAAPELRLVAEAGETSESIYEWTIAEELNPYDVGTPGAGLQNIPAAPTSMELVSGAATAVTAPDGTVTPRIEVKWTTPTDGLVTQIQMQYQLTVGSTSWVSGGLVDVSLTQGFISPVVAGQQYNVRIRSLRANGASSPWVEIDGFTAGLVLNSQTQDGVGIGSLAGEAYVTGNAAIVCNPFTALIGQLALSIFPSGAVTISTDGTIGGSGGPCAQQTLYYVYYSDPTTVGGDVTPIATTNRADFLGKAGHWLIDSIVTPYCSSSGGSGSRYYPSTASDGGTATSRNSSSAYDSNLSTYATLSGSASSAYFPPVGGSPASTEDTEATCDTTFSGFPSVIASVPMTLSVILAVTATGAGGTTGGTVAATATIAGAASSLLSLSAATAQATYTATVPAGTNLNSIAIEIVCTPETGEASSGTHIVRATVNALVTEIYVQ